LLSWLRRPKGVASRGAKNEIGTVTGQFEVVRHGSRERRDYFLFVPRSVRSEPRPLVVMLHGCLQRAEAFAASTRMNDLAHRHRFLVLYPEQSQGANALRCWNWFLPAQPVGEGEGAAIAALIRETASSHPADLSRIYLAGFSAGGALTAQLAMTHGALFAACAIISGLMHRAALSATDALQAMRTGTRQSPTDIVEELATEANPERGFVPALVISGDRDSTVHPSNAEKLAIQFRRSAELMHQVSGSLDLIRTRLRHPAAGRSYRQDDYGQRGRTWLRSISIEGLGHAWSGGDAAYPFNDERLPDASALVWDFLSRFRRPHGGLAQIRPQWRRWLDP
jgi:poly(hydroxyalkanoate) depolymerase family esterase